MAISQEKRATKSTSLESRWAHSQLFNISIQMFFPRLEWVLTFWVLPNSSKTRIFQKANLLAFTCCSRALRAAAIWYKARGKKAHTQKGTRAPWFGWFSSNVEREGSALEDNGVNFLAGRIKMMKRVSLILSSYLMCSPLTSRADPVQMQSTGQC